MCIVCMFVIVAMVVIVISIIIIIIIIVVVVIVIIIISISRIICIIPSDRLMKGAASDQPRSRDRTVVVL